MSSRKRGQAGREGQQGREFKMGIIHVTIQIVHTDMMSVENVDERDERDHSGDTKARQRESMSQSSHLSRSSTF